MILLLEDNDLVRGATAEAMRSLGLTVRGVATADAALVELRRATPAVLVLDLVMDGFNGLDLLAALAANPRLRPAHVVVTTALPDPLPHLPPRVTVLRKPFDVGELAGLVRALAASKP